MRDCRQCGGTGFVILDRSWFKADGYRKERCGVCEGAGQSTYQPHPEFAAQQAQRRKSLQPQT